MGVYGSLFRNWADMVYLQHLPAAELRALQIERFRTLVEFARTHSPFYRELYSKAGVRDLTIRSLDDVRCLPTVDKHVMLQHGVDRVLTVRRDAPGVHCDMTSGSTAEPFPVYVRNEVNFTSHLRVFFALHRGGYLPHHRLMMIWRYDADKIIEIERQTPLGALQRLGLFRREIVSIFQSPATLIETVRRRKPHTVFATRSILELMANTLQRRGETLPVPLVVSSAETMLPAHRELFVRAFGGRVLNLYGCMEAPTMAVGDDDSGFHVFSNFVFFEYENVVSQSGVRSGDILMTNLLNFAMPFIRYRLGDRGRIIGDPDTDPARFIGPLQGRNDDTIVLPNGFHFAYHHSYKMFAGLAECRQYRVVQMPQGGIQLWLVPTDPSPAGCAHAQRSADAIWRQAFPDVPLTIECVTELPPGRTGKHRAIERL